ncbi:hypothetical protein D2T31_11950 [Sinirhodobacter populi]|uniref:Helix-turn-helix domain-containing protein n=1 Tax=Paenirhodobacter populi TaxID=2306993 RepID=A0A443K7P4_9RHOB|nr:hypothetical protein [Sinirhodobacter populi]RWR28819.1 hypothetical protein D2T31_11950 [Sinirhodobacter populi]
MATFRHPVTGVEINALGVFRPRKLDDSEAETARLLRQEGHKVQDIAAMLGTNQGRVQTAIGPTGRIHL